MGRQENNAALSQAVFEKRGYNKDIMPKTPTQRNNSAFNFLHYGWVLSIIYLTILQLGILIIRTIAITSHICINIKFFCNRFIIS